MRYKLLLLSLCLLPLASLCCERVENKDASYKVTLILRDGWSSPTQAAISEIYEEYPSLKEGVNFHILPTLDLRSSLRDDPELLRDTDLVIVDCMSKDTVKELKDGLPPSSASLLMVSIPEQYKDKYEEEGLLYNKSLNLYFSTGGKKNIKNAFLFTLQEYGHFKGLQFGPPEDLPKFGLYHPAYPSECFKETPEYLEWYKNSGRLKEGRPFIGIPFYSSYYQNMQTEELDMLIKNLEAEGFNVLPAFGFPSEEVVRKFYLGEAGAPRVSVLVSFLFKFLSPNSAQVLGQLGIPVINLMPLHRTEEEWESSTQGLSIPEVAFQLNAPELSGLIQPTVISTRHRALHPEMGLSVISRKPHPEHVKRIVARVKAWIALQQKPNREKKVAFVYYNFPPGKHRVGASYLNIFRSLEIILARMRQEDYKVERTLDAEEILSEVLGYARNVGSWAPGELEKIVATGRCVLLPIEEYKGWFGQLPQDFQSFVVTHWGEVENTNLMTYTDTRGEKFIVLPVIQLGNICMLPQPVRGWSEGEDLDKLYHSQTLPPHHQYIATYLWLQKGFRADAVIHVGKHGTLEWLSGKETALSMSDAPEVLMGGMPDPYIYIVDDVGEALQAKRRGNAVIISHMVPPLKKGGLYGRLAELGELASLHADACQKNPELAEAYSHQMATIAKELGLDQDLSIKEFDHTAVHKLMGYVEELKKANIPYGLHTFGWAPDKPLRQSTVEAILEVDKDLSPEEREKKATALEELILKSKDSEINALMEGLSGKFVTPGPGNDPVRNPSSLPTGRNLYSFDIKKIPPRAAWELGSKLAEQMVDSYRSRHKKYPEKIAFVLWSTETIRSEGVVESQILRLLGVKPVWDARGEVIDVELIPQEELGRPRVDTVLTISGAYRDHFGNLVVMIDRAVKLACSAKEGENYIREHFQEVQKKLLEQGSSEEEARQMALARIFSEPSGEYGTKVEYVVEDSGHWESEKEVARVYTDRMAYSYGADSWGKGCKEVFKLAISGTDMVFHSRTSNVYGVLDNDDVFQYEGALALAIRTLDGKSPEVFITNMSDPTQAKLQDIKEYMGVEINSRYFNPAWIRGMMAEGYSGGKNMTEFVEYLWGWQVTLPEAVDAKKWQLVYEIYLKDKYGLNIEEFFKKHNPHAQQVIAARMLEAVRKSYWSPSEETLASILETLARNIVSHNVSCAIYVCNNPLLNDFVTARLQSMGKAPGDLARQYSNVLKEATQGKQKHSQGNKGTPSIKKVMDSPGPNDRPPGKLTKVKGHVLEELGKEGDTQNQYVKAKAPRVQEYLLLVSVGVTFFTGYLRARYQEGLKVWKQ